MCGIAGIIGNGSSDILLLRLLDRIRHRGELSHFAERESGQNFAIGCNRLGIVDPLGGTQPVKSSDGLLDVVANGEIYNYRELGARLFPGSPVQSDTHVIVEGWKVLGNDLLPALKGMYAFALVDKASNDVVLARDPFGIKPMFYSDVAGSTLFASELKALAPEASVKEILTLAPGHALIDAKQVKFADLPDTTVNNPIVAPVISLRKAFEKAVATHLPHSSEDVAVLLSGGIDSSTLTLVIRRLHSGSVRAFTLCNDEDSEDYKSALQLCLHLGVEFVPVRAPVSELVQFYMDRGVWMTETYEPPLVRNAVAYHFLCREVRKQGFKFAFSGEGADEVFGGYDYFAYEPSRADILLKQSLDELHKTYLQMADRASMYATLEVRVPYLDLEFARLAVSLPAEMRFRGELNKWILREMYRAELPECISMRGKLGMNAGAGYGSNDPGEGVYSAAIRKAYTNTQRRAADLEQIRPYVSNSGLDGLDEEIVFNFARFVELGYVKLAGYEDRVQLNTKALKLS